MLKVRFHANPLVQGAAMNKEAKEKAAKLGFAAF